MIQEYIKLLAPLLIMAAWANFAIKVKFPRLIGVGLFFASYVAFSQNFSLIYREIHQGLQILLVAAFIVSTIRSGRMLRINMYLGVFLFFIVMSLIFSTLDEDAISQLLNYLVAFCVANYLFISLRSLGDLDHALNFVARLSLMLALFGLFEVLLNMTSRAEATFSNPNYYGLFLGVGFCIVFAKWDGWQRNFSLLVVVSAILFSGSRSAMIFPILQLFWMIYRGGNIKKFMPLVIVLGLAVVYVLNSGSSRYLATDQKEASDAERIIFANVALNMSKDHPLTGVGWGRFINEFGNYSSYVSKIVISSGDVIDVSNQDRRVTHNDYMRILAELGWPALCLVIIFIIYGLRIIIKNKGFGLDYVLPIWLGLLLFSATHNNMNSAFFWFFLLLPFHVSSRYFKWTLKNKQLIRSN
jgi:O-antigen ligase